MTGPLLPHQQYQQPACERYTLAVTHHSLLTVLAHHALQQRHTLIALCQQAASAAWRPHMHPHDHYPACLA